MTTMLIVVGQAGTGRTHNLINIAKESQARSRRVFYVLGHRNTIMKNSLTQEFRNSSTSWGPEIKICYLPDALDYLPEICEEDIVLIDADDLWRECLPIAKLFQEATEVVLAADVIPATAWTVDDAVVVQLRPRAL